MVLACNVIHSHTTSYSKQTMKDRREEEEEDEDEDEGTDIEEEEE